MSQRSNDSFDSICKMMNVALEAELDLLHAEKQMEVELSPKVSHQRTRVYHPDLTSIQNASAPWLIGEGHVNEITPTDQCAVGILCSLGTTIPKTVGQSLPICDQNIFAIKEKLGKAEPNICKESSVLKTRELSLQLPEALEDGTSKLCEAQSIRQSPIVRKRKRVTPTLVNPKHLVPGLRS